MEMEQVDYNFILIFEAFEALMRSCLTYVTYRPFSPLSLQSGRHLLSSDSSACLPVLCLFLLTTKHNKRLK